MGISKLRIKPTDQGLHIFRSAELGEKYNEGVVATKEEIIDALIEMPDSDEILAKLQDRKLAKKKEQYEKLQPVGFEHAPASAKEHRKYLTDQALMYFERDGYDPSPHFDNMKCIHENFSYNIDGTLNILSIKKTICNDLTGKKEPVRDANKLTYKGHKLMTDSIEGDIYEKESDFYIVLNALDGLGLGGGMYILDIMAGLDNKTYWTATRKSKNEFYTRDFNQIQMGQRWSSIGNGPGDGCYYACGIKDM